MNTVIKIVEVEFVSPHMIRYGDLGFFIPYGSIKIWSEHGKVLSAQENVLFVMDTLFSLN